MFLIDNNQKSNSTELDWIKLSDKPASLGIYCPELEDGIVFYYEYPEDIKEASIKALHTAHDEITTAQKVVPGLPLFLKCTMKKEFCTGRYLLKREIVCLEVLPHGKLAWSSNETTQSALIDTISKDTEEALAALLEEKALERCAIYSPFCVKREGYSDIFITASDAQINWNEATELLYQITEFGDIKEIEGITDIMVTRQDIVGRMPDSYNDIYIWDIETGKCQKIYDASLNDNTYLGYNTYTEEALFGITGNDNGIFHAVRISWDGKLKYLADIKFSYFKDFLPFPTILLYTQTFFLTPHFLRKAFCKSTGCDRMMSGVQSTEQSAGIIARDFCPNILIITSTIKHHNRMENL